MRVPRAERLVREQLRLNELTVDGLLERCEQSLGAERLEQGLDMTRASSLSQRHSALAALAELAIGTDLLGEGWWTRPVTSPVPQDWHPLSEVLRSAGLSAEADDPTFAVIPDEVLAGRFGLVSDARFRRPVSTHLANAISSDVAGPAVGRVDLNRDWSPQPLRWPAGTKEGEIVWCSYGPGARIQGTTVLLDGRQAVDIRADAPTRRALSSEVGWAVRVQWQFRLLYLPGEQPGSSSDPLAWPLAPDVREDADRVREHLQALALPPPLGPLAARPWTTVGDVVALREHLDVFDGEAMQRLGLPDGQAHHFSVVLLDLMDGRPLSDWARGTFHVPPPSRDEKPD